MAEDGGPPPKKAKMTKEDLEQLSKEELLEKCNEQETYIKTLEAKVGNVEGNDELAGLRESEEKLRQQQTEATRRESILVMRLTSKEQETQDFMNQINDLKQAQNPSAAQLRSMLLDPAINLMFQRMKKEMEMAKDKQEQAQNDLAAWKFTPDSQTGKRLMNKCRMLLQENEELGRVIASGRTAKLEGEIALEKKFIEEMKKSQAETDEFLVEMDEDVEGMQSTIYFLQQQLKDAKDQLEQLQQENAQLRQLSHQPAPAADALPSPPQQQQYRTVPVKTEPLTEEELQADLDQTEERTRTDSNPSTGMQEQVRTSLPAGDVMGGSRSKSNGTDQAETYSRTDIAMSGRTDSPNPTQQQQQQQHNSNGGSRSHSPASSASPPASASSSSSPHSAHLAPRSSKANGCSVVDHVDMETDPVTDGQQQQQQESSDNGNAPKETSAAVPACSPTENHNTNNHRTSHLSSEGGCGLEGTDISSDAWSPPPPSRHTPTEPSKDLSMMQEDLEQGRDSSEQSRTAPALGKLNASEALQNGLIGPGVDQGKVEPESMDY